MHFKGFETVHTLHHCSLDGNGHVWVNILFEGHNDLLGLHSIEQLVVGVTPLCQTIHLLPVDCLIAVFDKADHCGVAANLTMVLQPLTDLLSWVRRE